MFDNTKPNVVLISDKTDVITMTKTLGPYKVAHTLRQAGFEVAVLHHASVFSISELKHMLAGLISDQTLFVGVNNFFYASMSDYQIDPNTRAVDLAKSQPGSILPHGKQYNQDIRAYIKQLNPECQLVLGGPSADDLEHNNIFDYIIVGYAEMSVVNLARHLLNSEIKLNKSYKSVYGPKIVNDSKAEGYDFAKSNMQYADHDAVLHNETLILEVGRGCVFKCAFCAYPMNGKKKLDFIRSKECLLTELLNNYERFGTTRYIICDDTFNDSVEKCKMLYEVSQQLPFKLEYWAYIRLDLMTAHPETIDYLMDSGLRSMFCGVETFNAKTASAIGKGGNRDRMIATVKRIKDKWGDQVNIIAGLVFGLPYESMDSLRQTQKFLIGKDNCFDSVLLNPLEIRPTDKNYTYEFLSDIDKNFKNYGYRDLGRYVPRAEREQIVGYEQGQMMWESDFTNYAEVKDLVAETIQLLTHKPSLGHTSFHVAGGEIDLNYTLNKLDQDIDWNRLDRIKWARAVEYKTLLRETCGISPYDNSRDKKITTFSEWVRSNNALVDKTQD